MPYICRYFTTLGNTNKRKVFSDPIYGFITIPDPLLFDLIEHRYFQRLRRISQMGLSYLVYPGAHHTRFHHALGAMHLMQHSVEVLRSKNVLISQAEEQALYIAILFHDIGHGPFSHAMESSIAEGVHHEQISLLFMDRLNAEFGGKLDLAIRIFKGEYPRKFMLQLISSQLDMDRTDYLKRDSFFTGVAEGNINAERLIQMMAVVDDVLVIEEKGIYSVEKFLMARRLMYWQAYLHKTSLVAELMLVKALKRARELASEGTMIGCSAPLLYFLCNHVSAENFGSDTLEKFALLDDADVLAALKSWQFYPDKILSGLCRRLLDRDLLKIYVSSEKFGKEEVEALISRYAEATGASREEAKYFIFKGKIRNQAYSKDVEPIHIYKKDGTIEDVIEASDQLNLKALSKPVTKYYLCLPKQLAEK